MVFEHLDENDTLENGLKVLIEAGLSDDVLKKVKSDIQNIIEYAEEDLTYRLKDNLAPQLASHVREMATNTIKAILEGREDLMRQYLSCKPNSWTGRSTGYNPGNRDDFHPLIHGKLFETGALQLRKQIVEAHKDFLATERMLDLEDQVKSLVLQLNKTEEKLSFARQELNDMRA